MTNSQNDGKLVNKWAYVALALLLGSFGVHKFFAGKSGQGFMYLVFCWTAIPTVISWVEGIAAIFKDADANNNILIK
ncbi:TM2 domain-containing protein [Listeria seeligeri]|uniref:TM2 domain-containing protein n=1 Tax=Listeria seeligeri TaxID=1640 RepID=UPI001E51DC93|nr:TM2 domain-containing protein [Listeria seeligeri]